ncbi:hypothetical protein GCM10009639_56120 [Kitasatospora putterlickiae]|uniref:Uncharacterized protein n=1 Tax=Kitasatospora putterlickiae TaxID=221725 RepID=A0ABN1YEA6_9ACTN
MAWAAVRQVFDDVRDDLRAVVGEGLFHVWVPQFEAVGPEEQGCLQFLAPEALLAGGQQLASALRGTRSRDREDGGPGRDRGEVYDRTLLPRDRLRVSLKHERSFARPLASALPADEQGLMVVPDQ